MTRRDFMRGQALLPSGIALLLVAPDLLRGRIRKPRWTKARVGEVVRRVEDRADVFRKLVNRTLDLKRVGTPQLRNDLKKEVGQLENALDKLRRKYNRARRHPEMRAEAGQVVAEGRNVNTIIRNAVWNPEIKHEWTRLRGGINELAGIFNVPRLTA